MGLDIAILEDHPIFAAGLRELVEQMLPSTNILCYNRLVDLLDGVRDTAITLVIADLHVMDSEGMALLETLRKHIPNALIVGITGDEAVLRQNRCNPMSEFRILSKMDSFDYITGEIHNLLKRSNLMDRSSMTEMNAIQASRVTESELTRKQMLVLNLIKQGLSNKEIARKLNVSPETVKTHAKDVYGRLGIRNRTQAATIAKRLNYTHVFSEPEMLCAR